MRRHLADLMNATEVYLGYTETRDVGCGLLPEAFHGRRHGRGIKHIGGLLLEADAQVAHKVGDDNVVFEADQRDHGGRIVHGLPVPRHDGAELLVPIIFVLAGRLFRPQLLCPRQCLVDEDKRFIVAEALVRALLATITYGPALICAKQREARVVLECPSNIWKDFQHFTYRT